MSTTRLLNDGDGNGNGGMNSGGNGAGNLEILRRYSQDFALKFEKLANFWTVKKYSLAYDLLSFSSHLNPLIQLIALVAIDYFRQIAWFAFFAAVFTSVGAIVSLIVIQGLPRWMQWLIVLIGQALVGLTGFGLCTGCDITLSAYMLSWLMLTLFKISGPGLKRYCLLEDKKLVLLSVMEFNLLTYILVLIYILHMSSVWNFISAC